MKSKISLHNTKLCFVESNKMIIDFAITKRQHFFLFCISTASQTFVSNTKLLQRFPICKQTKQLHHEKLLVAQNN